MITLARDWLHCTPREAAARLTSEDVTEIRAFLRLEESERRQKEIEEEMHRPSDGTTRPRAGRFGGR